ncbi:regulator of Vps4 activity in the MVB pathway-domain-containing protein [Phascolomyces articulosus]|uniref:Regulator of Vps4 activity in the MVB pathway-domain-containing protein n=1 Tax=Phascolomyces articulosus TaxID=60185 RepID=A0AAD5K6B9_9FUNG|nr:regulator of Vps4 activity in the MVB pathway-domain-containing protein [Phascolomyces articulosus]
MFQPNKLKVHLKLSINRLKMLQAKKNSLSQHQRREIATLLDKGKEESARIRVEHIIREDLLVETMEMLELYCDLLLARFGLIEQYKECDPGIFEAVNTLIWAAPRVDEVKELAAVRDQFAGRYGKEFVLNALDNVDQVVNDRVIHKLQVSAPDPYLVERYLEEIAKSYDVLWTSNILAAEAEDDLEDDDNSSGGGGGLAEAYPAELEPPLLADPAAASASTQQQKQQPSEPSQPPPETSIDLPEIPSNMPPTTKRSPAPAIPKPKDDPNDFDALAKRLEALKRR